MSFVARGIAGLRQQAGSGSVGQAGGHTEAGDHHVHRVHMIFGVEVLYLAE